MRAARDGRLTALLVFAALALVHTWPLITAPASLSRNDHPDTLLNEWIIAWVAHQAPRHPLQLFDANIFYPDRGALAYSEPLIVPAAMGAPLLWAGASPVLAYNLLLLAGFTLTGWAMSLVVWRWTGDWPAGIVSGVVVAFNAHVFTRLPHMQAQHPEFLPLALLAFDRVLVDLRVRSAMMLALWFVLQGLVSIYLLVFTTTALVVSWLVQPDGWWGMRGRRAIIRLALAGVVALAALAPFLAPYLRHGLVRPLDEVAFFSARWRDYLTTPARVHYTWWSSRFYSGTALFPGAIGLLLAAVAVLTGCAFRDRRARMALAFGVAGVVLSFGPAVPGYAALYAWILPLQSIRAAARFGYLAIVATAILGGFGLAWMRTRWHEARWLPAATWAVFLLANIDAFSAPLALQRAQPPIRLYDRLRGLNAVVVEFPFFPPDRAYHNAPYLMNALRHWRPMVNGYSGVIPESYVSHYLELQGFPDDRAMGALHSLNVTHVVVHDSLLRTWNGAAAADAVAKSPFLEVVERADDVVLYHLR